MNGAGWWRCRPIARRILRTTWLREHPGVAVISCARGGTPTAVQVADRFHLLQNLAEMLEGVSIKHAKNLRAAEQGRHEAVAAENGMLASAILTTA